MDNKSEKIIVYLSVAEFDYVSELVNTMYASLKKFPKNMRTPKFYLLENLVNNIFTKENK